LQDVLRREADDATEENIQSRCAGMLLMALSTGGANRTEHRKQAELGVGYCTLYGDMAGGLARISEVPKTMVYRMSRFVKLPGGR